MGNRFSLAQEEREEAEYQDLVQAVERVRRYADFDADVEAGITLPGYQSRAPVRRGQGHHDPLSGVYRDMDRRDNDTEGEQSESCIDFSSDIMLQ